MSLASESTAYVHAYARMRQSTALDGEFRDALEAKGYDRQIEIRHDVRRDRWRLRLADGPTLRGNTEKVKAKLAALPRRQP